MSRGLWVLLIAMALVVGAVAVLLTRVEWVEQELAVQPTEEAVRKPYLAATHFLEAQGVDVIEEPGELLIDLTEGWALEEHDTLLLIDAFGLLPEHKLEGLLAWVEAGGHLILSGQNPYMSSEQLQRDVVFEAFGVAVERNYEHLLKEEGNLQDIHKRLAPSSDCASLVAPVSFHFQGNDQQVEAVFPGWQSLVLEEEEAARTLADSFGIRLAQFEVGAGLVTFVIGTELWSNPYVDCYDNAFLLWQLVGDGNRLWVYVNQEALSLWQLLWGQAWLWIIFTCLYVVLFLWRQAVRFGPLITPESSHRRSFLEHIEASARLFWRYGQGGILVDRLREDVWERAALRVPGFRSWADRDQQHELARLTGLPEELVSQALTARVGDEAGFVRCIHDLQQIRNKL